MTGGQCSRDEVCGGAPKCAGCAREPEVGRLERELSDARARIAALEAERAEWKALVETAADERMKAARERDEVWGQLVAAQGAARIAREQRDVVYQRGLADGKKGGGE